MMSAVGHATLFKFTTHKRLHVIKTDTSFSVTSKTGSWGSKSIHSLFATPGSWYSPRLYRMIFDIFRFNHSSMDVLDDPVKYANISLGAYLDFHHYGQGFRDDYLIPLASTYWSLPPSRVLQDCPIWVLVRCFHHFGLLRMWGRPEWYAFAGGSRTYVDAIGKQMHSEDVHLNTAIHSVSKNDHGVVLKDQHGMEREFDHVIMATHAQVTLAILRAGGSLDMTDENALVDSCDWSDFEITMHWDDRLMPEKETVRGAWNTTVSDASIGEEVDPTRQNMEVTFDMNSLHNFPREIYGNLYGTVNPSIQIDESKIFQRLRFSTPIFTPRLLKAQNRLNRNDMIRDSRISIVGAWRRLGSHEDAWITGLEQARKLGADLPFTIDEAMRTVDKSVLSGVTAYALESVHFAAQLIWIACFSFVSLLAWIWSSIITDILPLILAETPHAWIRSSQLVFASENWLPEFKPEGVTSHLRSSSPEGDDGSEISTL
ncbi:hypothetical protein BD324DRAFT_631213 [Kockovaella imperatae]|uniref:Amine oxidase domain-containing protein n=1 Tax=Kockovaella imperatae TaxID=4999 RepID=A0A1Y1UCC1_9TREE|nr:hypothetical protein BD324DRAFT_631213 [Kockovaella imperatae]ORX35691.1 hypothetical protein BD324DRAFT_631213 [Kockovaella imperatae]